MVIIQGWGVSPYLAVINATTCPDEAIGLEGRKEGGLAKSGKVAAKGWVCGGSHALLSSLVSG